MAKVFIKHRFQKFDQLESMGVVNDTTYIGCFWPKLDKPTPLFAEGSSGIKVQGSPTPRNVVFPKDTEFLDYYPDALYPAEQAVKIAFPNISYLVNLTEEQAAIYLAAYEEAVKSFPSTHSIHSTRPDCFFLREKVLTSAVTAKPQYTEYVAEISKQETDDLVDEKVQEQSLRDAKTFVRIDDGVTVLVKTPTSGGKT